MGDRIAESGNDPKGALVEFIRKDVIKPMIRPKIEEYNNFNNTFTDKWALCTTKNCSNQEQVPKMQQYKEYNFPSKDGVHVEKYKNFHLKSDNISIYGDQSITEKEHMNKTFNPKSYYAQKQRFGVHTETYHTQKDYSSNDYYKTINNRSGAPYNIITLDGDYVSKKAIPKLLDVKTANMKKGICEFSDLTRDLAPNFNPIYKDTLNQNNNIFRVQTGIFTHLYDRSHRNGNIVAPFGSRDNRSLSKTALQLRYTMKNVKRRQEYQMKQEMKNKI